SSLKAKELQEAIDSLAGKEIIAVGEREISLSRGVTEKLAEGITPTEVVEETPVITPEEKAKLPETQKRAIEYMTRKRSLLSVFESAGIGRKFFEDNKINVFSVRGREVDIPGSKNAVMDVTDKVVKSDTYKFLQEHTDKFAVFALNRDAFKSLAEEQGVEETEKILGFTSEKYPFVFLDERAVRSSLEKPMGTGKSDEVLHYIGHIFFERNFPREEVEGELEKIGRDYDTMREFFAEAFECYTLDAEELKRRIEGKSDVTSEKTAGKENPFAILVGYMEPEDFLDLVETKSLGRILERSEAIKEEKKVERSREREGVIEELPEMDLTRLTVVGFRRKYEREGLIPVFDELHILDERKKGEFMSKKIILKESIKGEENAILSVRAGPAKKKEFVSVEIPKELVEEVFGTSEIEKYPHGAVIIEDKSEPSAMQRTTYKKTEDGKIVLDIETLRETEVMVKNIIDLKEKKGYGYDVKVIVGEGKRDKVYKELEEKLGKVEVERFMEKGDDKKSIILYTPIEVKKLTAEEKAIERIKKVNLPPSILDQTIHVGWISNSINDAIEICESLNLDKERVPEIAVMVYKERMVTLDRERIKEEVVEKLKKEKTPPRAPKRIQMHVTEENLPKAKEFLKDSGLEKEKEYRIEKKLEGHVIEVKEHGLKKIKETYSLKKISKKEAEEIIKEKPVVTINREYYELEEITPGLREKIRDIEKATGLPAGDIRDIVDNIKYLPENVDWIIESNKLAIEIIKEHRELKLDESDIPRVTTIVFETGIDMMGEEREEIRKKVIERIKGEEVKKAALPVAKVTTPEVEITPEKRIPIQVTIRRHPVEINEGDVLFHTVTIDSSDKLNKLKEKARELKELPERDRIKAVNELVRKTLRYPYELGREKISEEAGKRVNLSEVVEKGVGVCGHFSALYAVLAQEAGLKVAPQSGKVKNIMRPGTGERLFKAYELGEEIYHAWIEIELNDGTWIPVDPTANVVGVEKGVDVFKEANYVELAADIVEFKNLPDEITADKGELRFLPGEREISKTINLRSMVYVDLETGEEKPYEYKGKLDFTIEGRSSLEYGGSGEIVKVEAPEGSEVSYEKPEAAELPKPVEEALSIAKEVGVELTEKEAEDIVTNWPNYETVIRELPARIEKIKKVTKEIKVELTPEETKFIAIHEPEKYETVTRGLPDIMREVTEECERKGIRISEGQIRELAIKKPDAISAVIDATKEIERYAMERGVRINDQWAIRKAMHHPEWKAKPEEWKIKEIVSKGVVIDVGKVASVLKVDKEDVLEAIDRLKREGKESTYGEVRDEVEKIKREEREKAQEEKPMETEEIKLKLSENDKVVLAAIYDAKSISISDLEKILEGRVRPDEIRGIISKLEDMGFISKPGLGLEYKIRDERKGLIGEILEKPHGEVGERARPRMPPRAHLEGGPRRPLKEIIEPEKEELKEPVAKPGEEEEIPEEIEEIEVDYDKLLSEFESIGMEPRPLDCRVFVDIARNVPPSEILEKYEDVEKEVRESFKKLEKYKLIEKIAPAGREAFYKLTDEGRELLEEAIIIEITPEEGEEKPPERAELPEIKKVPEKVPWIEKKRISEILETPVSDITPGDVAELLKVYV
ncbi:MAG: hypothetical protein DRO89_05400, partial [Candidatus Altiarchaeales archaeon]